MLQPEAMLMSVTPTALEGLILVVLQPRALLVVWAEARNHVETHNPCLRGL